MSYIPSAIEIAEINDAHDRAVKGEWTDEELTPEELNQLDRDCISDDHADRYSHLSEEVQS